MPLVEDPTASFATLFLVVGVTDSGSLNRCPREILRKISLVGFASLSVVIRPSSDGRRG